MKKYQVLEHMADLKIRAFGRDRKELFENALLGMFEGAYYEPEPEAQSTKRKIKLESIDLSSLLVDFLNEALYLSEINWEVYEGVEFEKFSEKEIEGVLVGKKLKKIGVQIKAATHHDLEIKRKEEGIWEAEVLFDV